MQQHAVTVVGSPRSGMNVALVAGVAHLPDAFHLGQVPETGQSPYHAVGHKQTPLVCRTESGRR